MTFPSPIRLLCLSMASFFLVHLALGLMVSFLAPAAIRFAERIRPRTAAFFLLLVRLFPVASGCFVVLGLCVPSYLWLESETGVESVGLTCLIAAILGMVIWTNSIGRSFRAVIKSIRFIRSCRNATSETLLDGELSVIEGKNPLVALSGILRARLLISRNALNTLSDEELAIAVRHERAHFASRDNLKRLLISLAPALLPGFRGFGQIEPAWARFAEWAADDCAVAGNPENSVSLAQALVRIARLGEAHASVLVNSLAGSGFDLLARVDRLLAAPAPGYEKPDTRIKILSILVGVLFAGALVALAVQPTVLSCTHRILERLIA